MNGDMRVDEYGLGEEGYLMIERGVSVIGVAIWISTRRALFE
jgi:hypothetical protein